MPSFSKIYVPCKVLGRVSNDIPVVTRYIDRRKENLLVTCVGRSFYTYGTSHFTLLSVSCLHEEDITCLAADRFLVFSAAGNDIYAWRRGSELQHKYQGHGAPVHLMLAFGPHLISIDESNCLKVWDIKSEKIHLELDFEDNNFTITALMHPATYLNKILLGSEQGGLQLWNLHTSQLIYTFKGWGSSVCVIEQSPALHVVGIGLKDGHIFLHNLQFDEVVMEFHQDWGIVTSLTFRTDHNPIMISGAANGYIVMWNLEERKVFSQIVAHQGSVTGMKCLSHEPLMVTSSPDNSLKLWIFDLPDGGARLLRLREGHSLPPSHVRFHGANGQNILSSGGDSSLRIFNTITETFNKSLGRASYNRKISKKNRKKHMGDPLLMPPIIKFTSEVTREKEWDNIAAIHLGIPKVTTWSYGQVKMGQFKLLHDRFKQKRLPEGVAIKAHATSLCLTHCGNFVVVGYSSGHCDRFNIQSGLHRATYGVQTAHVGAVRGVATDSLSQFVITGGNDKLIKWWNFQTSSSGTAQELSQLEVFDSVTFFIEQYESSLIGVALEDFTILIIDNDSRGIVRKFVGHLGRLTDATFSYDSRWLITASMDRCICTWDVPSGSLVDVFKMDAACTSLTFSPTSELLATTHVNDLGVYLWSNKAIFSHVSWSPLPTDNLDQLPVTCFHSPQQDETVVEEADAESSQIYESANQIDESLLTLSGIANSRWQNLLHIDVVKRRNKPKEPPKTPKAAPFFLPTVPSLNIQFDLSVHTQDTNERVILPQTFSNLTVFGKLLLETVESDNFTKAFEFFKGLGPSALDFEIHSLSSTESQSIVLIGQFMKMIEYVLGTRTDFELAEAYMGLFLKVQGQFIVDNYELVVLMDRLRDRHMQVWEHVRDNIMYNSCIVQSLERV